MLHSAQQKILNNKSEISFNHVYFNQTRNPPYIGVARIFDWGGGKPQITCNDIFRNFRKSTFLWGQRYRKMEDQKQ